MRRAARKRTPMDNYPIVLCRLSHPDVGHAEMAVHATALRLMRSSCACGRLGLRRGNMNKVVFIVDQRYEKLERRRRIAGDTLTHPAGKWILAIARTTL